MKDQKWARKQIVIKQKEDKEQRQRLIDLEIDRERQKQIKQKKEDEFYDKWQLDHYSLHRAHAFNRINMKIRSIIEPSRNLVLMIAATELKQSTLYKFPIDIIRSLKRMLLWNHNFVVGFDSGWD